MYIIYDGRHIKNKYSGLGRFTFTLLLELIKLNNFSKLEILIDENMSSENEIFKHLFELQNIKLSFKKIDAPLFNIIKGQNIKKYVNKQMPDLYFHPHFDLPIGIKVKSIFVVHDVFSKKTLFHENDGSKLLDFLYGIKKKRVIKNIIFNSIIKLNIKNHNTSCIAVSNATKKDLLEFLPKEHSNKIKVVYESFFNNSILKENEDDFNNDLLNNNYLLYVGDRRPHKNLKHMIDIFIELSKNNKRLKFYIVGNEETIYYNYKEYLTKINNNNNIIVISNVSDLLLNKLYKNADAFLFLSKHEGFGLPLLEAAKYNIKIITSSKSSMLEIAPPSSLFIDPYLSVDESTKLIFKYLNSETIINNEKYLTEFSWKKAVQKIFYSD